ncbi:MAG: hypothetical protein CVU64_05810 [Deltaproteobacteria bacterium HGW-Deltaproteobacteria-21]|nr:MAG: hypothetical protein CVU64_05810 [Deltaproteobacteria bacterium HGW-Deltaproteobacteria-21]
MNHDYRLGDEHMREGICSACDDSLICRLRTRADLPVFFCEEYRCESNRQREIPEDFRLPNHHSTKTSSVRPEKAGDDYIGLCRTCLKLPACAFLKPGGGTWDCESYE